ncbi:MAG: dienelactone hydrolase family protein [Microbacteriaceae bacterium]
MRPAKHPDPTEAYAVLSNKPLLILLHGYGSNEHDLASLAGYLPENLNIVSLRAPIIMQTGSYTWFPVTESGNPPADVVAGAVQQVIAWLQEEILSLKPSSIGLLGFSMGGAMTIQLLRTRPDLFAYGLNLSGFSVAGEEAQDAALAKKPVPLFWGYDIADPVIPAAAIARTAEFVPKHFQLTERRYADMAHSISIEELEDIAAFLTEHSV